MISTTKAKRITLIKEHYYEFVGYICDDFFLNLL